MRMEAGAAAMNAKDVTVIIVNWNRCAETLACLASVARTTGPVGNIVVVDNGSTDGSVAAICAAYPSVRMIEAGCNTGYAAGVNVGLQEAMRRGATYALLLNNDSEVASDCVPRLVAAAGVAPEIGIVGPTIYYFDRP